MKQSDYLQLKVEAGILLEDCKKYGTPEQVEKAQMALSYWNLLLGESIRRGLPERLSKMQRGVDMHITRNDDKGAS